jgi:Tol biopolymer transport system component
MNNLRGATPGELERMVQAWLVAEAPAGAPSKLDESVIASVQLARQRPAWLAGLRIDQGWRPRGLGFELGRRGLQLAVLVLMLVLAAAFAFSAGHPVHVPAPFTGPARNGLIAYGDGGQIVIAGPDGSGRSVVANDGATHSSPIWSPDGLRLAFWTQPASSGGLSLTVVDAYGKNARVVSGGSPIVMPSLIQSRDSFFPAPADWAPDGTRLAYSETINGVDNIVIATLDGRDPKVIGDPTFEAISPVWSPNGKQVAFAGGRYPTTALYLMNADGSGPALRLTKFSGASGSFTWARWSPDGRQLVYDASGASLGHGIWLVNADGSNEHPAATGFSAGSALCDCGINDGESSPTWSPDGQRIAFFRIDSATAAGPQLFVMSADETGVIPLTNLAIDDSPMQWSPDGKFIVVTTADLNYALVDSSGAASPMILPASSSTSGSSWERLALNP